MYNLFIILARDHSQNQNLLHSHALLQTQQASKVYGGLSGHLAPLQGSRFLVGMFPWLHPASFTFLPPLLP